MGSSATDHDTDHRSFDSSATEDRRLRDLGEWLSRNTGVQFWTFQAAGWTALTVLSYFSLTLWYNPPGWTFFSHTILQSVTGILLSLPLQHIARYVWNQGLVRRLIVNLVAVLVVSFVWTAIRIISFEWLTGLDISYSDYGGWINMSVLVFAAWTACYHGIRYYRQLIQQKELIIQTQQMVLETNERAQTETLMRQQADHLSREAQLRMLRYQLNPHFLFNTFNSITALIKTKRLEEAEETIARISDFLRFNIEHDTDLEHSLNEEIAVAKLYLGIEKIRFDERLQVSFDIDDQAMAAHVPSLLLQPLFENAIKHAVAKSLQPTRIHLSAAIRDDRLRVSLSDTGPGEARDAEKSIAAAAGLGLKNTVQRLETLYGDDFAITFENASPQGLVTTIDIPYRESPPPSPQTRMPKPA